MGSFFEKNFINNLKTLKISGKEEENGRNQSYTR
jgi:hypothetical protein